MKKAIIIGASSGIGRELAKILVKNGYIVGVTGRRTELLHSLKDELKTGICIKTMDISQQESAINQFIDLIDELDGIDLVVISAGTGFINPDLDFIKEKETIEVNVSGFSAIATTAIQLFKKQGYGHLVGISSVAALFSSPEAPSYNASKAFVSNYLKGLRKSVKELPITITEVLPGFVDTAMAKGEKFFWMVRPECAAEVIYNAIKKKRKSVYVTKRWRLAAIILKRMH